MLSALAAGPRVVGAKQTRRAVADGRASAVFLAKDADPKLTGPMRILCVERGVPLERGFTMRELGRACGIAVGSAMAALLKQ